MEEIVTAVRRARPALPVALCFVDVIRPSLVDVLTGVVGPAVVVPVLLSGGYHVRIDIPSVLARRPEVVTAPPLGPDPRLADALAGRLAQAGRDPIAGRRVAMIAAGSSDSSARADIDVAAAQLSSRLGCEVTAGVLSGPGPTLADIVATAATPVDVAGYLLAGGFFAERLRADAAALGVRVVAGPIGAHPVLTELILARYDTARYDTARHETRADHEVSGATRPTSPGIG
ncbi:MAG: sirohydrochlorin chelatase [Actinomycetota bacterium]|nr:sirohydrochlorin chelatase [Actinomycetota bacterium]